MSPTCFLLGFGSILSIWLITSLGLPVDLWTFGLIPVLSVYVLCDHTRLREVAAFHIRGVRAELTLATAIVTLFSTSWLRFLSIHFLLWKLGIVLVWLYFMIRCFDFEKMMYMANTYGAVSKSLVWNVITSFTGQAMWMTYKGDWAFCCPYTRSPVHLEIDHYYTLQEKPKEHDDVIPESYDFSFHIGSCDLVSAYSSSTGEDSGNANVDYFQDSTMVPSPEESNRRPKTEPCIVDHYSLEPILVNKLEVSLKYENKAIESYTYYDMSSEAVGELRRTLNILKNEGNVIFSTLSRYNGSDRPQAHARCHEFGELLDLILIHDHKLHHVDLRAKYNCIISGRWVFKLCILPVMISINYYQIVQKPASPAMLIILLTMYGSINFLDSVLEAYPSGPCHIIRASIHFLISWVAPNSKDGWYRFFQVKLPFLTYCNDSYGYPCRKRIKELCILGGSSGRLHMTGAVGTRRFHMDYLEPGLRVFNLNNVRMELIVDQVTRTSHSNPFQESVVYVPVENDWRVDVQIWRRYDEECCYHESFQTNTTKAMDLVALMNWIQDNGCIGVCKEMMSSSLIYTYTYEEICHKVLVVGSKPMIHEFNEPFWTTWE